MAAWANSVDRFLIHPAAEKTTGGDFGEFTVGVAFLVDAFVEEVDGFFISKGFGEGAGHSVGGDFVMFDAICGGDEDRVTDVSGSGVGDVFAGFLDEAAHGFAVFADGVDAEVATDADEAVALQTGFLKMHGEGIAEVGVGCVRNHLRKRGDELGFDTV